MGPRVPAQHWRGCVPTSADTWYVDTSALVKVVVSEPESDALLHWLRTKRTLVSCELICVEAVRAVRLTDTAAVGAVRQALNTLTLLVLDRELLDSAAMLEPAGLRSLDAIHLAAALRVGWELTGVVTYDTRMIDSAQGLGLRTISPANE